MNLNNIELLSQKYTVPLHESCKFCGAFLLQSEIGSKSRNKERVTPCCKNGRQKVPLPEMVQSTDKKMEKLICQPLWGKLNRHINHDSNFVTTLIKPNEAHGFYEPKTPPCYLNLHGVVYHCLRRPGTKTAVVTNTNQISKWHTTAEPEIEDDTIRVRLRDEFQKLVPPPSTKEYKHLVPEYKGLVPDLIRTSAFKSRATANADSTAVLESDYIATDNSVAALYKPTDTEDNPPELTHVAIFSSHEEKRYEYKILKGVCIFFHPFRSYYLIEHTFCSNN